MIPSEKEEEHFARLEYEKKQKIKRKKYEQLKAENVFLLDRKIEFIYVD